MAEFRDAIYALGGAGRSIRYASLIGFGAMVLAITGPGSMYVESVPGGVAWLASELWSGAFGTSDQPEQALSDTRGAPAEPTMIAAEPAGIRFILEFDVADPATFERIAPRNFERAADYMIEHWGI